ncbi:hypothetical protein TCAL_01318 [Tigriopus californicus]|uniref:Small ribosomal subunit protein uS14 n=1 Tax=Tigriopus californicus TaxID=6832 RepID=A0A553PC20_TIGCA|nr:small ribosomal subunit protein uS14m-like [Tigriopus californicus]TRY75223.1 hypothetical protein TCAL_01318 [Tigriopus californicus]
MFFGLISWGRQFTPTLRPLPLCRGLISGPTDKILGYPEGKHFRKEYPCKPKHKDGHHKNLPGLGVEAFKHKPVQDWYKWDGFGPYKVRSHSFPNNITLRDHQRRRIFAQHAEKRNLINCIRKADLLPREIRKVADNEIQGVPRDSSITRLNRRCTLTGRPRGVFHQFRVSRMIFRAEADYNKISGVQRAHWLKGIDIKP